MILSPSILSADFGNLEKDISIINRSPADWIHVDVMDGSFVPNISFGFPILKFLKQKSLKPLDVHLMIVQPERYIEEFKKNGADILTVHYEVCTHLHSIIKQIKKAGMKAAVAINPHTPVFMLADVLSELDMVLIMSVNPGFAAQQFIESSYKKIKDLKRMMDEIGSDAIIQVDGGVNLYNKDALIESGVQSLVVGSAIFDTESIEQTINKFKN